MRLLFIVDGRSPIALNWIEYFLTREQEVHFVSTYPCRMDKRVASFNLAPVAFSSVKKTRKAKLDERHLTKRGVWGASLVRPRTLVRQWLGPFTFPSAAGYLKEIIERINPDLIHAMRIPYEGMLAALAKPSAPLLISVWGNDFTLHAPSTPLMSYFTRLTLERADALHTDCQRDVLLAREWGFFKGRSKPNIVLPGAGGVRLDIFHPLESISNHKSTGKEERFTVINPRGFRAYIRNDVFFQAIPVVLAQKPNVRFVCPSMAGEPRAFNWMRGLGIADAVELLPRLSGQEMASLFRHSQVAVSPSTHDGTPNTLLEAMACGCFPVAGDLDSIREWIVPGENGLLVDPEDPISLGEAILAALDDQELRIKAGEINLEQVVKRASYPQVMQSAFDFYHSLVNNITE